MSARERPPGQAAPQFLPEATQRCDSESPQPDLGGVVCGADGKFSACIPVGATVWQFNPCNRTTDQRTRHPQECARVSNLVITASDFAGNSSWRLLVVTRN